MPLHVPVSSASIAALSAAEVWTFTPYRRLTNLSDDRALKIDKIVTLDEHSIGTLPADGTEQDVAELTDKPLGTLEGYVDLSNMQAGDAITIKEYIRMKVGGIYRLYDSSDYGDVQTKPALHVVKLPAKYGAKVTLQQTGGVNRSYDYNFFKEVLA